MPWNAGIRGISASGRKSSRALKASGITVLSLTGSWISGMRAARVLIKLSASTVRTLRPAMSAGLQIERFVRPVKSARMRMRNCLCLTTDGSGLGSGSGSGSGSMATAVSSGLSASAVWAPASGVKVNEKSSSRLAMTGSHSEKCARSVRRARGVCQT